MMYLTCTAPSPSKIRDIPNGISLIFIKVGRNCLRRIRGIPYIFIMRYPVGLIPVCFLKKRLK